MSDQPTRTLYHYTAPVTSHLGCILESGVITLTESNLSFDTPHAGPDVVWLTDSSDPAQQVWDSSDPLSLKTKAVLVVELPAERCHHWPTWSSEHGVDPATYAGLADTGGDPESWWVTDRPIRRWDIAALVIAPFVHERARWEGRAFAGDDLRRLFDSAGARRALGLPHTKKKQVEESQVQAARQKGAK